MTTQLHGIEKSDDSGGTLVVFLITWSTAFSDNRNFTLLFRIKPG